MSLLSHFSLSLPAFITDTNKNFLSQTLFLPGHFTLSLSPSIATEQAQTFHPSLSLSYTQQSNALAEANTLNYSDISLLHKLPSVTQIQSLSLSLFLLNIYVICIIPFGCSRNIPT